MILENYVFRCSKTFVWIVACAAITALQYCAAFSCLAFLVASINLETTGNRNGYGNCLIGVVGSY